LSLFVRFQEPAKSLFMTEIVAKLPIRDIGHDELKIVTSAA